MYDVTIVGSGFGSLTAACLLVKQGLKICILEQANYPGGCASSFKRKGYIFETGATTLTGLDKDMPLHYLLNQINVELPTRKLDPPMQVHFINGIKITRYSDLNTWITEAERVFGTKGQRAFWEHCYKISRSVWSTSIKQLYFPISKPSDLWEAIRHASFEQVSLLPAAFRTMEDILKKFDLLGNQVFVDFINEQLLITAQNYITEVNELFGAAALCYTLYGNYYVDGGLINLVTPLIEYIEQHSGEIKYKHLVQSIEYTGNGYLVQTNRGAFKSNLLISGIPLNNTLDIYKDKKLTKRLQKYLIPKEKLNSAFTVGIVLQNFCSPSILHHQVHVPRGLPVINSKSIFISFSHPEDKLRSPNGDIIASVSTHVHHPDDCFIYDKGLIENAIVESLEKAGLIKRRNIKYIQSATPGAWIFWTGRAFGAVGGYPQFKDLKPWQMKDARLDNKGAYICGDTVYPGQGIPGVCLSGIIAVKKLMQDHIGK
jgi:C-3',4' desaturase CrtD